MKIEILGGKNEIGGNGDMLLYGVAFHQANSAGPRL
jgi:hypothetical protein